MTGFAAVPSRIRRLWNRPVIAGELLLGNVVFGAAWLVWKWLT